MQQQPKQIGLEHTSEVRCNCGGDTFSPAIKLRKVSRLVTGQPNDSLLPIDVFLCVDCGEVLEELLPEQLKNKPKIDLA